MTQIKNRLRRTTTTTTITSSLLLVAGIAIAMTFTIPAAFLPAASAQMPDTTTTTTPTDGTNGNNTTAATSTATTTADEAGRRLTVLGTLGISLVRDVEVTSTGIDKQQREVTVTLSSSVPLDASTPAVTVAAFRGQIDLVGLLQQHMMMMPSSPGMAMGTAPTTTATTTPHGAMGPMMMTSPSSTTTAAVDGMQGNYSSSSSSGMGMFDIKSFIDALQIGSTTMPEGWTSEEPITIPVIDNVSNNVTAMGDDLATPSLSSSGSLTATTGGDTDIILVLVLPNTTAETQEAPQTIDNETDDETFNLPLE